MLSVGIFPYNSIFAPAFVANARPRLFRAGHAFLFELNKGIRCET